MLKIYEVSLEVVRELEPVIEAIGRRNPDLSDQLDRASSSVPLAIAEGAFARGKYRNAAYQRAIGEMRESVACCDVAIAKRYLGCVSEGTRQKMRRVIGTLVNVVQ